MPTILAFVLLAVLVLGTLTSSRTYAQNQDTTTPSSSSQNELRVENAGLTPSSTSGTSTDDEEAFEQDRVADVQYPDEATYQKEKAKANAKAKAKKHSGGGVSGESTSESTSTERCLERS